MDKKDVGTMAAFGVIGFTAASAPLFNEIRTGGNSFNKAFKYASTGLAIGAVIGFLYSQR